MKFSYVCLSTCKMDNADKCIGLPLEILHLIAQTDELSYRAMLSVPQFARSITPGKILDYMELFGHSARISVRYMEIVFRKYKFASIEWQRNGKLHRLNGPANIHENGSQYWYHNGEHHRLNGPAIIYQFGRQEWWQNNKLHRSNGPAVTYPDGSVEYWEYGVKCDGVNSVAN